MLGLAAQWLGLNQTQANSVAPISYTHLDVYKRQVQMQLLLYLFH